MSKIINWTLFITFIIGLFVQGISAEEADEGRYWVKLRKESECKKSNDYKEYSDGVIKQIHNVIVKRLGTYQNTNFLQVLENQYVEDKDPSPYVDEFCINNKIAYLTYLTKDLVKKVEDIDDVVSCEPYKNAATDYEEGDYVIFVGYACDQSVEYNTIMEEVIGAIHKLIEENKSTYKNDSKLTEQEQNYNKESGGKSPYVLEGKCVDGETTLSTYLSPELVPKVNDINGVIASLQAKTLNMNELFKSGAESRTKSFMMGIIVTLLTALFFIY